MLVGLRATVSIDCGALSGGLTEKLVPKMLFALGRAIRLALSAARREWLLHRVVSQRRKDALAGVIVLKRNSVVSRGRVTRGEGK